MRPEVTGYVLAGGKSSRMGHDKALLELGDRPLVQHAVEKLRTVCRDVYILSRRPELGRFAPLVPDLHAECGPLGGMEAALFHSQSAYPEREWCVFLPVDMPMLPTPLLEQLVQAVEIETRIAMFSVDGMLQPTVCMVQREMAATIAAAVGRGDLKLTRVFREAAEQYAIQRNISAKKVLLEIGCRQEELTKVMDGDWLLWFSNLNTPEEFAEAQQYFRQSKY